MSNFLPWVMLLTAFGVYAQQPKANHCQCESPVPHANRTLMEYTLFRGKSKFFPTATGVLPIHLKKPGNGQQWGQGGGFEAALNYDRFERTSNSILGGAVGWKRVTYGMPGQYAHLNSLVIEARYKLSFLEREYCKRPYLSFHLGVEKHLWYRVRHDQETIRLSGVLPSMYLGISVGHMWVFYPESWQKRYGVFCASFFFKSYLWDNQALSTMFGQHDNQYSGNVGVTFSYYGLRQ